MKRQMHLVGYLMAGPSWHNNGSWRHPGSDATRATDPAQFEGAANIQGVMDNLRAAGALGDLTLREAGRRYGVNQMTPRLIGNATIIADQLQEMFEAGCCDGFMVVPATSPCGYEDFCRLVVPELQRRDLFRTRYPGKTLQENLFHGADEGS